MRKVKASFSLTRNNSRLKPFCLLDVAAENVTTLILDGTKMQCWPKTETL